MGRVLYLSAPLLRSGFIPEERNIIAMQPAEHMYFLVSTRVVHKHSLNYASNQLTRCASVVNLPTQGAEHDGMSWVGGLFLSDH